MSYQMKNGYMVKKVGIVGVVRIKEINGVHAAQFVIDHSPRNSGISFEEARERVEVDMVNMARCILAHLLPNCIGCETEMSSFDFTTNNDRRFGDDSKWKVDGANWTCPECK